MTEPSDRFDVNNDTGDVTDEPPHLSDRVQQLLGKAILKHFQDTAAEIIPDLFLELLRQIEAMENRADLRPGFSSH
jgi:hypothetical protein